jgi:hypothetical protein
MVYLLKRFKISNVILFIIVNSKLIDNNKQKKD